MFFLPFFLWLSLFISLILGVAGYTCEGVEHVRDNIERAHFLVSGTHYPVKASFEIRDL